MYVWGKQTLQIPNFVNFDFLSANPPCSKRLLTWSFRNANSGWIWSLRSRVELLTKPAFSKSTSCKPSNTLSDAFNAITQRLSNNTKTPQTPQHHRRLEESKGIDSLTKPTSYWVSSLWVTKSTSVNIDWNWSYPTAQDHIIQCNCQQSQWQSKREMKHSCPLKSKYSLVSRKENQSCSCLFKRVFSFWACQHDSFWKHYVHWHATLTFCLVLQKKPKPKTRGKVIKSNLMFSAC